MKNTIVILLLAVFASFSALAEVAVIVHPSNSDDINKAHISKIFLGKSKSFPGGAASTPISQNTGTAVKDEFDQKVLGKSESQLKAYWSKLLFTGKGQPPKEVGGDADVISMVAADPSMIGFVDASQVNDSVKVIATF